MTTVIRCCDAHRRSYYGSNTLSSFISTKTNSYTFSTSSSLLRRTKFQPTSTLCHSNTESRKTLFQQSLLNTRPKQQKTSNQYRSSRNSRSLSSSSTQLYMVPEGFISFTDLITTTLSSVHLPLEEIGREISESFNIGNNLSRDVELVPETTTSVVLSSVGYDLLVFLAAAVFVTPVSNLIGITPILGYLIVGAIMGPHGLDIFANSKADIELGDIGILFLLFSEGLEVSNARLKKLTNFLPLGIAQISLVTTIITMSFLIGIPQFIHQFIPLDSALFEIDSPVEAFVLAFAGALSTSAFIFPVLKERGWEEEESGEASTSILLLQDLIVAPILVLLPFLADETQTDYTAIGVLTAKAVFGFGAIMYAASFVLRRLFNLVAETKSTETFVALSLLVAAGMGAIAKEFGLTDTAGAFAAGMLLANTNYRAQIQADILPFKGILLGIFFMGAGSTFDAELVFNQFPTIMVGALGLMAIKILTLGAATIAPKWMNPNRLSTADALRVTLLLSGGGEFAFVVLAVSEKLKLIPTDLGSILTAIVLLTMGITPLLGQAADKLSEKLISVDKEKQESERFEEIETSVPSRESIVVCGYGDIGKSLVSALDSEVATFNTNQARSNFHGMHVVAFDTDESLIASNLKPANHSVVLYGDGASMEVIRSSGITKPAAIFVAYEEHGRVMSAVSRLRYTFFDIPIYARAATRAEAKSLRRAGATEVVVEADEMPRAATLLMRGVWGGNIASESPTDIEQLRQKAATAAGVSLWQVDELLDLFAAMDQSGSGLITIAEIENVLQRSTNWIATDAQIERLDAWIETTLKGSGPLDEIEFCRLYGRSPDFVKQAFGLKREKSTSFYC